MRSHLIAVLCGLLWSAVGVASDNEDARGDEHIGSWKNACVQYGLESAIQEVTVTADSMFMHDTSYEGKGCKKEELYLETQFKYSLGKADAQGARFVDVVYEKVTLTITLAEIIGYFNRHQICGFKDWAVNVTKDVTGKRCGPPDADPMPARGQKYYTMLKASANALQIAIDSDEADGSTPYWRARLFDEKLTYQRQ